MKKTQGLTSKQIYEWLALGHVYFIAFYALKKRLKFAIWKRRVTMWGTMRIPTPAFPLLLLKFSFGDFTKRKQIKWKD